MPQWTYQLFYSDCVAVTMKVLDVGYKEFQAQKNLYAVRVDVSPITHVSDVVAAMDPLLDPLGIVIPFDDVIFVMEVPGSDPNAVHPAGMLSHFPKYVILIASETTSDLLMEVLAGDEIFGVDCNPVRIGPRYPQPQIPLLRYLSIPSSRWVENLDDLVMMLWKCYPPHRHQQLVRMMESPWLCTEMILWVLYGAMFPEDPDVDEY